MVRSRSAFIQRAYLLLISRLAGRVSTAIARVKFAFWGVEYGAGFRVYGRINIRNLGSCRLGSRVRLRSGIHNFVGLGQDTSIWVARNASLIIGDDTGISNTVIFCESSIQIGTNVFIGGGCRLFDTDFHELSASARVARTGEVTRKPVRILDDVFIGAYSTILKGVVIGRGAIIGAGSVVSRDVPGGEVWAGVPARKIGLVPD